MLIDVSKCKSTFPVQRLILSGLLAVVIMTVLLYVSINHAQKKYVQEYQVNNINVDLNYVVNEIKINNNTKPLHNDFKELTEEEMKEIGQEMSNRYQHVQDYCDMLFVSHNGYVNAHEFFINKDHHIIWCNVFKAASSSWMHNFNTLAGYNETEGRARPYQELARELYPRPTVEQLKEAKNSSTSMIIVRHPFERLSSAYRDKIQNSLSGIYADLGDKIIKKYRKRDVNNSESTYLYPMWPTFEEFVSYILDQVKQEKELDIHWTPYSPFCTPCQFNFDVIIKFETIERDQRYFIQKMGLQNIIKPQWKNPGESKIENNGVTTSELMKEHYSQLNTDQMSKLYWMYRQDFLLFNYTPSVFDYAKDKKDLDEIKQKVNDEIDYNDDEESDEEHSETNEENNKSKT